MSEIRKSALESLESRVLLSGEVEQVTIDVGDSPSTVVVADFDGDGLHDFAVTDGGDSVIRIVFGDPSSSSGFSDPDFYDGGTTPTDLHAFDFDGDGDQDLTFFDESSGVLGLYVNDGTGTMTWGGSSDFGSDAVFVRAEPLTSGAHHDHVVAYADSIEIRLFDGSTSSGDGLPFDGTIPDVTSTVDLDGSFSAMEFHDVDFDHDLDILVTMSDPDQLLVLLNDGSGSFTSTLTFDVGSDPAMPIISDVNGDEMPDILVANTGDDTATIIESDGSGGWAVAETVDVGDGPITVFPIGFSEGAEIFNLFSINQVGGDVSIFEPDTTGAWALHTTYDIGEGAGRPWVGDFDDNGFGDLVVPATGSDQVVFLYNVLGEFFPGGGHDDHGGSGGSGGHGGSAGGVWNDIEDIRPFDFDFTPDEFLHGDFDGDGEADLLVSIEGEAQVVFLYGTGDDEVFDVTEPITVPFVPDWLGVLPGGEDGGLELALFNESTGRFVTVTEGASGVETHVDLTLPEGVTDVWLEHVTGEDEHSFDLIAFFEASSEAILYPGDLIGSSEGDLPEGVDIAVGAESFELDVFDWDGDGHVDVLSLHDGGLSVALNQGDGTFNAAELVDLGSTPDMLLFLDLENDGETDIAWIDGEAESLFIVSDLDGMHDGEFDVIELALGSSPTHLLSGLGGAGTPPPLTVLASDTGEVWDVRMHPSEGFAAFEVGEIDPFFTEIAVASFTGEDVLDIALMYPTLDGIDLIVDPWVGGTTGSDGPDISIFELDEVPDFVTSADLNGDGLLDLVASFTDRAEVVYLFATGQESPFEAQEPVQTPFIAEWIGVLPGEHTSELVLFDRDTNRLMTMATSASDDFEVVDITFPNEVASISFQQFTEAGPEGGLDLVVEFVAVPGLSIYPAAAFDHVEGDGAAHDSEDFELPEPITAALGDGAHGHRFADIDGDGDLDVVSILSTGFSITRNDGESGFSEPIEFDLAGFASDLMFTDVDGDDRLDLVYLDSSDNSVNFVAGFDPASSFEEVKVTLHSSPTDLMGGFGHPLTVYSSESGDAWTFGTEATGELAAMPMASVTPGLTMPLVGNFGGGASPDIVAIDASTPALFMVIDAWNRGHDRDPAADVPVPATPDLLATSDNGEFDDDDRTTLNNARSELRLQFRVDDVVPGARVMLWIDGIRVGSTVVEDDSTSVTITTDGFTVFRNGFRNITASMEVDGVVGYRSEALQIHVFEPEVSVEPPADDSGDGSSAQTDEDGHLHVHWGDDDEDINLHDQIPDAPPITGDVKLMHERKDGDAGLPRARRYAAGQSEDGLILFTGKDDGSWGHRNLTEEIPNAEPINGDLDTFETPWGNLNVVGQNAEGDIVIYWQDGGAGEDGEYRWNYSNISDDQLAANDQEVPAYTSDIDSYITPWGGSNVVGLDDEGHIRIVWWSAESVIWVSTDLTEYTESLAMVGEVSAYVTSWGGINIAGQNSEGRLVVTWWVPGGEWQVTDMGEFLSSPDLSSGSISSFITDGTLNIAGLTEEGDVIVYSWAVEDAIWSFDVLEITEFESVTLVGRVQGYSDSLGNITLFTTDLDANIHELAYDVAAETWDLVEA